MKAGDKVSWLYTSPRGWNLAAWVPATVVKVTKKRVTIELEYKAKGVKRHSVCPDKLRQDEPSHPAPSMGHPLDIEKP